MRVVDITQLAVARQRVRNGARATGLAGVLFLLLGAFGVAASENWRAWLVMGGAGVAFILAGLLLRRGHRGGALLGNMLSAACLLLLLINAGSLGVIELASFLALGYFIVQCIRGTNVLGAAPRVCPLDNPSSPVLLVRWRKPKNPVAATGLMGLAALLSLAAAAALLLPRARGFFPSMDVFTYGLPRSLSNGLYHALFLGLIGLSTWCYTRGRRHFLPTAAEVRARDTRKPILLLRSFGDDMIVVAEKQSVLSRLPSHSFEDVLTKRLWDYGPVVAIGRPGEPLPPFGAAREYLSHQDWQTRFKELTASAQLILLILGRTEGVLWEIRTILGAGLLRKTIVVFPPVQPAELETRWQRIVRELSDTRIPDGVPAGQALLFLNQEQGPQCLIGKRRNAYYYREALDIAAASIVGKNQPGARAAP